jgi:hypothetical protein
MRRQFFTVLAVSIPRTESPTPQNPISTSAQCHASVAHVRTLGCCLKTVFCTRRLGIRRKGFQQRGLTPQKPLFLFGRSPTSLPPADRAFRSSLCTALPRSLVVDGRNGCIPLDTPS